MILLIQAALQRSLARHYSDKFSLTDAIAIQLELVTSDLAVGEKISVYADLVDNLSLVGEHSKQNWCAIMNDIESLLHLSVTEFPWGNVDGKLPENVPRGNKIYYALYTASEECEDYFRAWQYLMKALDMERKGRHMRLGLSTNKYKFEDKIGNKIPIYHYLKSLGLRGDLMIVYPIIVMGSSRAAASMVSNILGNHDAIFSMSQDHSRLDYTVGRRLDLETARGVFVSKINDLLTKIVNINQVHSVDWKIQHQKVEQAVKEAVDLYLRYNFGIAQMIRDENEKKFTTLHYVEYVGDNIQYLGILRILFPSALIINVLDDPLSAFFDTITERTDQSMEQSFYALHPLHTSKHIAIQANLLQYFRNEFNAADPPLQGVTDVIYSDLLANPKRVLQEAVVSRLQLQWQSNMLTSNGVDLLLHRAIRRQNMARNYLPRGDISIYQSTIYTFLNQVQLTDQWFLTDFPYPEKIRWDLGPQRTMQDDGCSPSIGLRMPTRRDDIGIFLDYLGLTVGAELGVQQAIFSNTTLQGWTKCKKYYLIDLWGPQDFNYLDSANLDQTWQDRFYTESILRLDPFKSRTELVFLRKLTSQAAEDIPDDSLDYVYVDARHDYCSVTEDISLYWVKLKAGGILAGHDYMLGSALEEFVEVDFSDRFDICPNGTIRERSVKGAVDDFAASLNLEVAYTFNDRPPFLSFLIRKPCNYRSLGVDV